MDTSHAPDVAAASPGDAAMMEASWHEPERFAEIFRRYFTEIHKYVTRRIGTDAADDIAAETFLAAFRRRESFDASRGAVRPWLYGIATNLIGVHRRAERRFYGALAKTPRTDVSDGHEDRVAAQVSAGLAGGVLAAALARLPQGDRDVLLLIALADLSYQEVAQALDIPYGTVGSRMNRARKKLREALGGVDPTLIIEETS
jgi:RNA polymerase sigma factor (sigma-70 family)